VGTLIDGSLHISSLVRTAGWQELAEEARAKRASQFGNVVTYSPKVFIPLTKLCRDVCHYCTFARPPADGAPAYMSIDEVLEIARRGAAEGCKEALFTLGDKPELRYKAAREQLNEMGFRATLAYLAFAAKAVLDETGLLPHLNPGVMNAEDIAELRGTAPSMGLMMESAAARLMGKGGVHFGSPDKDPVARFATLETAGRLKVPFTTGILIGIGESFEERAETLALIEESHQRWGHIQEVIVQNFRAKDGTPMHAHPEPTTDDMAATLVMARLILSPEISLQAPPNLAADDDSMRTYLRAGINDWGGVSPVTIDHVNPEAPWPPIDRLRAVTETEGHLLVPRLTVYPRYIEQGGWIDPKVRSKVLALADTDGLARAGVWHAGEAAVAPDVVEAPRWWSGNGGVIVRPEVLDAIDKGRGGGELNEDEIDSLFGARGPEMRLLFEAADQLRAKTNGDAVTYVVNRNINYTNMCYFRCGFCAFSKGPKSLNLRGEPYLLDLPEVANRCVEAWERGATEVCLQGGIHPSFTGDFYIDVVRAIKEVVPDIHVHAFSPLEVWQGAETKGVTVEDFLKQLKDEGLSTLPGTAAEILDDEVRAVLCPDKINTSQWSFVAETAHRVGLKMSSTIMFGHVDSRRSWARHLGVLRNIQKRTGGFTEFVPLPFVHMGAPIFLKGKSRRGPTIEESLKMHAVARLALNPWITNIQTSWVKMGLEGARLALKCGVNDLGGTLMNESISRAAGAAHGQEVSVDELRAITEPDGRPLVRRTTLYGLADGRTVPSLEAAST